MTSYQHKRLQALQKLQEALASAILLTLCMITATPTASAGEQPIEVYSQHAAQVQDNKVQGLFHEIWRALITGGPKAEIVVVPLLRKEYLFNAHTNSCMYPANARHIAPDDNMIQSLIITKMNLRAYSNPDVPKLLSLDDFKGKKVVAPFKNHFQQRLRDFSAVDPDTLTIIEVQSAARRSTMLFARRVDAMINVSPIADFYLQKRGRAEDYYAESFIMEELPLSVICHTTPENQALIDTVNSNKIAMEQSGAMDALFTSYGLNHAEFHVPPERTDGFIQYSMDPSESRAIKALSQDHRWAKEAAKQDEDGGNDEPFYE